MTKTICDICENEMETSTHMGLISELTFCLTRYGKIMDVCNDCREKLNEWIEERKAVKKGQGG